MCVRLSQIDMQKMPLGKLSKKQIQSAYAVLTEALGEVEGDKDPVKLLDCSNRFFTLIPHDFGMKKPPLLDNPDIIKVHTPSHCRLTHSVSSPSSLPLIWRLLPAVGEDKDA